MPAGQEDRRSAAVPQKTLEELGLDELIGLLPPVGEEWLPTEKAGRFELKPAAAEMKRRLEQGVHLASAQWRRALVETGALRIRRRWPVEHVFAVSMQDPAWDGVSQIRLVPNLEGLAPAEVGLLYSPGCGTLMGWMHQAWLYQELGELPLGRYDLVFDVTIERGAESFSMGQQKNSAHPAPPPGILWRGKLAFEVEVVETLDEAVPPVSSAEIDQAVRESLSLAFDTWRDGPTAILVLDPNVENGSFLAGVGISLQVEVLHCGEVQDELSLVANTYDPLASGNSVHDRRNQPIAFCARDSIPASLAYDLDAQKEWSLRVRGTSHQVWKLWEAWSRWSGEFEVPIDELIRRERELAPDGRGPWLWFPSWR